jgi:hypothetical protein
LTDQVTITRTDVKTGVSIKVTSFSGASMRNRSGGAGLSGMEDAHDNSP